MPHPASARSCLHCELRRAVADERLARGGEIRERGADPHPLAVPFCADTVYRACRGLLQAARRQPGATTIVVSLVDMAGKTHADVLATVYGAQRTRLVRQSFPRFRARALAAGFVESVPPE